MPFAANSLQEKKTGSETAISGNIQEDNPLRLGIIGFGKRGEELVRGLAAACSLSGMKTEIRSVCEINQLRRQKALANASPGARDYSNYVDLLGDGDIDAVIIATPDHWHVRMAADAASRGLHVYLEKPMARNLEEAKLLRTAVKESRVVFQLGHQGRQRELNLRARELVARGTLGAISLVETSTNLNDSGNKWVREPDGVIRIDQVDWDQFQGPDSENHPFSLQRYLGWRNYRDYGTGMAGEFFSNEYDVVNSILDLGIPDTVMATGGLYSYPEEREVPDVFQVACEYPGRSFTLLYSGTLLNGVPRGTLFMGRDATLELGRILSVWAEEQSVKYKSRIEAGMIDPAAPFVNYQRDQNSVDAVTSATSKYYADRGLVHTYREGKKLDTTGLHLAEWMQCIREGGESSCNIDRGFEEAVTAYMANLSCQEGRKLGWDPETETII